VQINCTLFKLFVQINPVLREFQLIVGNLLPQLREQSLVTALLGDFCVLLGLL
jgi:hypothetical protein